MKLLAKRYFTKYPTLAVIVILLLGGYTLGEIANVVITEMVTNEIGLAECQANDNCDEVIRRVTAPE